MSKLEIVDGRQYKVITLCGSTKFKREFLEANFRLSMQGHSVFSVGWFGHADGDTYTPTDEEKSNLDELHKRKIWLSDEVFVIDVDEYIGDSTRSEIEYAEALNLPIRYLSKEGMPSVILGSKKQGGTTTNE